MSSGALLCTGEVTIAGDGAPLCSGAWTLVPVPAPFAIDEAAIQGFGVAFGVGFSLVFFCWFAGWSIKTIVSLIR